MRHVERIRAAVPIAHSPHCHASPDGRHVFTSTVRIEGKLRRTVICSWCGRARR